MGLAEIRRKNLDSLLEIVSTGMFTVDRELRIRSMNREAERLLGVPRGAALGLSCRDVLGEIICSASCALRKTLTDGEPRRDWSLSIQEEGGPRRDLVLSSAFLDAPEPDAQEVAVAIRDVTESEKLRRAIHDRWVFHGMVCSSSRMKQIISLVREMAPYDSTVLVLGESGTGKELVARAVHEESPRKEGPFVNVNCSAYSEGVLESELFGHVRGAYTGALRDRKGRFEAAIGGTIFLDEIGELSPKVQVKLLRVLQERVIERVGDQRTVPVNIRVIAATNRDLREEVAAGRFREDLYYRLNVIAVHLPALRERREDIPALAEHFLARYSRATGKHVVSLTEEAMDILFRHEWPGNVRELENAAEHAVVRARGPVVLPRDLPPEIRDTGLNGNLEAGLDSRIDAALRASGGRIGRAAELLGIHRVTLWRRIKRREA